MIEMKYDKETKSRIGLVGFENVQIDTLGFMSLGDKVTSILNGSMDFHGSDRDLEYDQEEGSWNDEDPEIDPTNSMLDSTDVHDIQVETINKMNEQIEVHKTLVTPGDTPLTTETDVSNDKTE